MSRQKVTWFKSNYFNTKDFEEWKRFIKENDPQISIFAGAIGTVYVRVESDNINDLSYNTMTNNIVKLSQKPTSIGRYMQFSKDITLLELFK